jgi:hypothetical protein
MVNVDFIELPRLYADWKAATKIYLPTILPIFPAPVSAFGFGLRRLC